MAAEVYYLTYTTDPGLGGFPSERVNSYPLWTQPSMPLSPRPQPTHWNRHLMKLWTPKRRVTKHQGLRKGRPGKGEGKGRTTGKPPAGAWFWLFGLTVWGFLAFLLPVVSVIMCKHREIKILSKYIQTEKKNRSWEENSRRTLILK